MKKFEVCGTFDFTLTITAEDEAEAEAYVRRAFGTEELIIEAGDVLATGLEIEDKESSVDAFGLDEIISVEEQEEDPDDWTCRRA